MLQIRCHDQLVVLQDFFFVREILNCITGPQRGVNAIRGFWCVQADKVILLSPMTTNLKLCVNNPDASGSFCHTFVQELKPALSCTDDGILDSEYPGTCQRGSTRVTNPTQIRLTNLSELTVFSCALDTDSKLAYP